MTWFGHLWTVCEDNFCNGSKKFRKKYTDLSTRVSSGCHADPMLGRSKLLLRLGSSVLAALRNTGDLSLFSALCNTQGGRLYQIKRVKLLFL